MTVCSDELPTTDLVSARLVAEVVTLRVRGFLESGGLVVDVANGLVFVSRSAFSH